MNSFPIGAHSLFGGTGLALKALKSLLKLSNLSCFHRLMHKDMAGNTIIELIRSSLITSGSPSALFARRASEEIVQSRLN
jgi:hypothetical protein